MPCDPCRFRCSRERRCDTTRGTRRPAPNELPNRPFGAILGGISFGTVSERIGRRGTIIAASVLSLFVLPLWAFGDIECAICDLFKTQIRSPHLAVAHDCVGRQFLELINPFPFANDVDLAQREFELCCDPKRDRPMATRAPNLQGQSLMLARKTWRPWAVALPSRPFAHPWAPAARLAGHVPTVWGRRKRAGVDLGGPAGQDGSMVFMTLSRASGHMPR